MDYELWAMYTFFIGHFICRRALSNLERIENALTVRLLNAFHCFYQFLVRCCCCSNCCYCCFCCCYISSSLSYSWITKENLKFCASHRIHCSNIRLLPVAQFQKPSVCVSVCSCDQSKCAYPTDTSHHHQHQQRHHHHYLQQLHLTKV